ncbi:MAG TPA: MinD/ParA family protein, partial [Actinomycetes bacterium]|nr:MinD/ParA family protein [Actinomycetes bacterium]
PAQPPPAQPPPAAVPPATHPREATPRVGLFDAALPAPEEPAATSEPPEAATGPVPPTTQTRKEARMDAPAPRPTPAPTEPAEAAEPAATGSREPTGPAPDAAEPAAPSQPAGGPAPGPHEPAEPPGPPVVMPGPTTAMPAGLPTASGELSAEQVLARPPGDVPASGWQAFVYQLTGGRWRPPPGPAELARRELEARITVPIQGCRRIAVVALKGGVGKTTTTACLGATFADHRADRVVAVDANPDPGTLAYRIRRDTTRTAKDLLANADRLERYADVRAYASQTPLRLEVIASEADPGRSEPFGEDEYRELASLLERFYSLVLTDCGPGLLHSAMRAILPAADQLVVVSAPSLDGARSASLTLDWLEEHGHGQLARSSVVVINAVRGGGLVDVDKLEEYFRRRCRAVVRVPFDRHLETGAEIVLDELATSTRRAYLQLAAAVADGFAAPSPARRADLL